MRHRYWLRNLFIHQSFRYFISGNLASGEKSPSYTELELKAASEVEAMEGGLQSFLSLVSYRTQDPLTKFDTINSGLTFPH